MNILPKVYHRAVQIPQEKVQSLWEPSKITSTESPPCPTFPPHTCRPAPPSASSSRTPPHSTRPFPLNRQGVPLGTEGREKPLLVARIHEECYSHVILSRHLASSLLFFFLSPSLLTPVTTGSSHTHEDCREARRNHLHPPGRHGRRPIQVRLSSSTPPNQILFPFSQLPPHIHIR